MNAVDTITNPIQRDQITFLVTAAQSRGELIRMKAVLSPGGGNQAHRHPSFSEAFEVLEGTLVVQLGERLHTVAAGQRVVAVPNTVHRFLNRTQEPTTFITEVRPGSQS